MKTAQVLVRAEEGPLPMMSEPQTLTLEGLYAAFRPRVHALCYGITRDAEDAEDAVQETFLSVQRALSGFRGEARISTWLYRIAVTSALRVRARRKRHAGDAVDPQLEDPAGPLDEAVDARRQHARLERAFTQLSADHQTVLTLFAMKGLTHREIAEVLDLKEGTVWSRVHLARKRLGQLLEATP